ncbi:MICOS complex subunit MIC27-like [Osmerus eperlanus]|uniref:MICOS complex subunit MIC27-like n=1 Tax=Osmerus eperlanus TaxID=29151 RepID=UPI002E0D6F2B
MAAKVVMVAVPTVLGIASFRVCSMEAELDGIFSPQQLSIYTPLPRNYQLQFVAEQPGALQSSVTSFRATLQPYIQAAQGACVSVKVGSVHMYHASQDVYHYLKDPPPGFLPRLGSIYMAGLVGMLVTRQDSRLRKLAVPLVFMGAGASVCYPAQSVALLKVMGKQLYAAGQWSTTTVSSLLSTVSPKEPSSKTQIDNVPKPEAPVEEEGPPVSGLSPDSAHSPVSPALATPPSDAELVVAFVLAATPTTGTGKPPAPGHTHTPVLTQADTHTEHPEISPEQSLMDFGQSDPEDADLYSTRS